MAEIFDTTGKNITKTGVIVVTKGFETLLFTIPAITFDDLTTEQIRIVRQRAGKNDEVTNGFVNFKQWVLIANYGASAICHDINGDLSLTVDLTSDGNIHLLDKEEIRIEMIGLKTAHNWKIDTIETFVDTDSLYAFDQKTLGADQKIGTFNTDEADVMLLEDLGNITDVRLTWDNGEITTHSMRELRAISRQIDPVAEVRPTGAVKSGFEGFLQLPVEHINIVELNKSQGTAVNIFFRREA